MKTVFLPLVFVLVVICRLAWAADGEDYECDIYKADLETLFDAIDGTHSESDRIPGAKFQTRVDTIQLYISKDGEPYMALNRGTAVLAKDGVVIRSFDFAAWDMLADLNSNDTSEILGYFSLDQPASTRGFFINPLESTGALIVSGDILYQLDNCKILPRTSLETLEIDPDQTE